LNIFLVNEPVNQANSAKPSNKRLKTEIPSWFEKKKKKKKLVPLDRLKSQLFQARTSVLSITPIYFSLKFSPSK
jgi:hypothetical protein